MYRRLILIANNGTKDNFLPGVTIDMKHYRQYFTMPEGGAWRSYEIKIFDNDCTREKLKKVIDDNIINVEYFQIVFCGHGYALDNSDTVLDLTPNNDCTVSEIKQWIKGKFCLIIADSCRKVYPTSTYIQDSALERMFSIRESTDASYYETCRNLYIQSLEKIKEKCPSGYIADAYSCSLGECAHDDDVTGGYYSYSLLCQSLENIRQKKNVHLRIPADTRSPIPVISVHLFGNLQYRWQS